MRNEQVTEHLGKIGRILLIIGTLAGLLLFGPSIKKGIVGLFYKSMQSEIRVTPSQIDSWARPDAVEVFSAELQECSFEPIGDFTINQSSRIRIRAFMHPQQNIYAMIYDQYGNHALLDFYTFYEDGSSIRLTTAANPFKSMPPDKKVWYIEEPMSIRELFEEMTGQRPDGAIRPVSREGFAPALEQYRREISLWETKEFMQ